LIRWSDDGNSFIVLDEEEFAKTLIPELFKHNNYASFVRQLNMYGFHKKVGLSDNSMRASERKNKTPSEYSNPYFKRGHPELLWLIQKPKNAPGHGPKTLGKAGPRIKPEHDGNDDDLNDDYVDGEFFVGNGSADPRISGGTRPKGPLMIRPGEGLAQDQLANVHRELQNIRQQQQVISTAINKLRREHEQLYSQAANFQSMHDRHENSITAILTFLATVYNRSLEGHGGQNIANMFAGVIPHDQNQGNVVDVGDISYTDLNSDGSQLQRPFKKQPLLLKAPPPTGQDPQSRASTISPLTGGTPYERPQTRQYMSQMQQMRANQSDQPRNIEEVTDPSTPQYVPEVQRQSQQVPQRDIMSVIHNTNARHNLPGVSPNASDFPTVLSSLENSGGNSPLTQSQRADMLRLIANGTNAQNENNNALMSPNPPQMPNMDRLAATRAEFDNLARMQAEQDKSVQSLTNLLQPLSPTGSIPGLSDNPDLNGMGSIPPALDLDQIFNSGDYFNDALLGNDFNLDGQGDQGNCNNDFSFDGFGGDITRDKGLESVVPEIVTDDGNGDGRGRIIETVNSSEGTSPATTADENGQLGVSYGDDYGERSPSKRQRKNQ
jgi:heat shock transcription factor, other eukaryote